MRNLIRIAERWLRLSLRWSEFHALVIRRIFGNHCSYWRKKKFQQGDALRAHLGMTNSVRRTVKYSNIAPFIEATRFLISTRKYINFCYLLIDIR